MTAFSIPHLDTSTYIKNLQDLLARADFSEVEREWQRMKALRKGKIWWYMLFDGPTSIEVLGATIGQASLV